jgi:hypothetical protein
MCCFQDNNIPVLDHSDSKGDENSQPNKNCCLRLVVRELRVEVRLRPGTPRECSHFNYHKPKRLSHDAYNRRDSQNTPASVREALPER